MAEFTAWVKRLGPLPEHERGPFASVSTSESSTIADLINDREHVTVDVHPEGYIEPIRMTFVDHKLIGMSDNTPDRIKKMPRYHAEFDANYWANILNYAAKGDVAESIDLIANLIE